MKASLIFHNRWTFKAGVAEVKIWKTPASKAKPEGYKYSMVLIINGERMIGYDNAEGKGHHRHYGKKEYPYSFTTIGQTLNDFRADMEKELSRRKINED